MSQAASCTPMDWPAFPLCSIRVATTTVVTGGGSDSVTKEEFTWINTMIGNVKRSINGTYHTIKPKHLPRYLAEFCYRFNRRFDLQAMMPRFLIAATNTPPMPGRLLKLAEAYG